MLKVLEFILTNNIFVYSEEFYMQIQGNTLLCKSLSGGGWDSAIFGEEGLSLYLCHRLLWHRYINDILLWDSPPDSLIKFMTKLIVNNLKMYYDLESS